jgi:hypothetical protein
LLTRLGLLYNAQFSSFPGFSPPASIAPRTESPAFAGTPFSNTNASFGDGNAFRGTTPIQRQSSHTPHGPRPPSDAERRRRQEEEDLQMAIALSRAETPQYQPSSGRIPESSRDFQPARSRAASRAGSTAPPPQRNTPPPPVLAMTIPDETMSADCDACMRGIRCAEPRIRCEECNDYDLCSSCYQNNRESKSHKTTHKVKRIKRTQIVAVSDFEHASRGVNPPYSLGGSNWTTGEGGSRWLNMRNHNNHARFLATGIESGHYNIRLHIGFVLSSRLSAIGRLQLSQYPLGKLKIFIGWPKDRNTFLNSQFADDEDLPDKLFSQKAVREYSMPDEDGEFPAEFNGVTFSLDANTGVSQIGFLLQWGASPKLTNSDDAIAKLSLLRATYVLCL